MYYYIKRGGEIYLLMLFNKNEQADLTKEQKRILSAQILELKRAK